MKNQKLFDYMHQEHGVTLLESDMIEIRNIVLEAIKDEEEQSVQTKKQALDFWYKYGHLPKEFKAFAPSFIDKINYFPDNPESD